MEVKRSHILLGMLVPFLSLVLEPAMVNAFFVIVCRGLVNARLDPLVNPNQAAGHMHGILGGSGINITYDYNRLTQSKCSSCSVQADKSNYWAPNLYWYNVTGDKTYHLIDYYTKVYYLKRPGPKNETILPWPAGLRMLAGNMNRRTFNFSNYEDQAVSFVCQDYYNSHAGDPSWDQRNDFFSHNCPNGMRAQLFFPSCWDGVNLDSADHKSHMAYPIQNYQGGDCPKTHPVHLISLFFEFVFDVADFPYYPNVTNWVFSTGDTTGLSFHGDFTNGWESGPTSPLARAMTSVACDNAGGDSAQCPPLLESMDNDAQDACMPEVQIPNEPNGEMAPIKALAGCNKLWSGPGPKPICTPAVVDPPFIQLAIKPLQGWKEVGCQSPGSANTAFSGASMTDPNMTNEMCMAFCDSKGFIYSGTRFNTQCQCGMRTLDTQTLEWDQCAFVCGGQPAQNCGDRYNVRLYQKCGRSYQDCMPNYTSLGCMAEPTTGRLMQGQMTTNATSMTPAMCGAFCAKGNYTYAGIEYGNQCFCSNSFTGYAPGTLPPTIDSSKCGLFCPGDRHQSCGGSSALSVFKVDGKTVCPTGAQLDAAAAAAGGCTAATTAGGSTTTTTGDNGTHSSDSGSMTGIAAGAAAGGALLIAGAVGGLMMRRRRQQARQASPSAAAKAYAADGDMVGASQFSLMNSANNLASMTNLAPPTQAMSFGDITSTTRRVGGPRDLMQQRQAAAGNSLYLSSEALAV